VQTQERAQELLALFNEQDKHIIIELAPDKPEDLSNAERALAPIAPVVAATRVGRNELCPCGSGTKFKKCCAGREPSIQP
jgi:SWIM/SEC-C metal-binding protein